MTLAVAALLSAAGLLAVPAVSAEARLRKWLLPRSTDEPAARRRFAPNVGARSVLPLVTGICASVGGALFGWSAAAVLVALGGGWWYWAGRGTRGETSEPLRLAAGWDLLATGLRAGMPLPVVVRAVAAELPAEPADALRQVADSLALGADPVAAWEPALRHTDTAGLAHAARRTARTGSGLAAVVEDIASRARSSTAEQAQARAQRAAVWVAAPLGLCFLPAFLCLGVLPVVVGMVHEISNAW